MKFDIDSLTVGENNGILIMDNDEYLVCGIFEAGSSDINAHKATEVYKNALKRLMDEEGIYIIREDNNRFYPYKKCDETLATIMQNLYYDVIIPKIEEEKCKCNCVILFINKSEKEYGIFFADNGSCLIDNEVETYYGTEKDSTWYLTDVNKNELTKYLNRHCTVRCGYITDKDKIAICSNGINSFTTKYNETLEELGANLFVYRKALTNEHKSLNLNNLYNALINNELSYAYPSDVKCNNGIAIIELKIEN